MNSPSWNPNLHFHANLGPEHGTSEEDGLAAGEGSREGIVILSVVFICTLPQNLLKEGRH